MKTLVLDDSKDRPTLIITVGSKTLLKRRGKSIGSLLRFVLENTRDNNLKTAIEDLQQVYQFMIGSVTTLQIKEKQ